MLVGPAGPQVRSCRGCEDVAGSVMESETQEQLCARFGQACTPVHLEEKVGISPNVLTGLKPSNAMRHPPEQDTCGWYIWAGEELPSDADFFVPLHLSHLEDWCPELMPYLGLPPGYRVLLADDYEDVWFDDQLLVTE